MLRHNYDKHISGNYAYGLASINLGENLAQGISNINLSGTYAQGMAD